MGYFTKFNQKSVYVGRRVNRHQFPRGNYRPQGKRGKR